MLLGALEAGGTKMVCAIGKEDGTVIERISLPTVTPFETMPAIIDYFKKYSIKALGVGCFGPIDLNRKSETYGYITTTPKLAWANYNIVGELKKALHLPVGFDTDVNGSVLGEVTFGKSRGVENCIYITIGTGVGVGIISNGKLLHGMLHPEGGHVLIARHKEDLEFTCNCPFHDSCLEGLAAGPAIEKRWGKKAFDLADNLKVWEMEAYYIAEALVGYILTLSPEKIILGGGVMHQEQLLPMIHSEVKRLLNGYVKTKQLEDITNYIVLPSLNDNQGILGCFKLAMDEMEYA